MTREEAIGWLQRWQSTLRGDGSPLELAILKAIEALKQPEIIKCKDCSISTFDKQTNLFYCNALDIYKLPEFYCGYARRREE